MTSSHLDYLIVASPRLFVLLPVFVLVVALQADPVSTASGPRRAATASDRAASPRVGATAGPPSLTTATTSVELQCPPCDRVHCWPRRPSRLRCPGGVVLGVCECCPVCARLDGQPCGGRWNYLGKCDAGLHCSAVDDDDAEDVDTTRNANRILAKDASTTRIKIRPVENSVWKPEGRCRPGQEMSDSPQEAAVRCFPPCTPEFCRRDVKQLCSANENAERHQSCQADCQHTSCSACRYRRPSVDCAESVRCSSPSDADCIRRFGRCVRRQRCDARNDFPCRSKTNFEHTNEPDVKFVCVVPECSTPTA